MTGHAFGAEGGIDFTEVASLYRAVARIPRDMWEEVRPGLREAGQSILEDARANASWSSRIPASLSLRVSFASRRPGVALRASLRKAPHARAYEGILAGTFRAPLFGDRTHWYPHSARPYLLPAIEAGQQEVIDAVHAALAKVHAKAGLT